MLDVSDLAFYVDDNANVILCLGPVQIKVCEMPEHFPEWQEKLIEQLNAIKEELFEYYTD